MVLRHRFTKIYRNDVWQGGESRSGGGSTRQQTEVIRTEIPLLLQRLKVRSILDAPCGDFNWMKEVQLDIDSYFGVDIVEEIIASNTRSYGDERRKFYSLDLTTDTLPRADLILCRDCLVHLTFRQGLAAIANFRKSGAKYLLTTTFEDAGENIDVTGNYSWRPLNLTLSPFGFSPPQIVINEGCSEHGNLHADKSLALWSLDDLPL